MLKPTHLIAGCAGALLAATTAVATPPAGAPSAHAASSLEERLPQIPSGTDVLFLLDGSDSIGPMLTIEMKKAARKILNAMDLPNNPLAEVAVLQFDRRVQVNCRFMNDDRRLTGCINMVRERPGTDIEAAMAAAHREFVSSRGGALPTNQGDEIILLFSDGHNNAGCERVVPTAKKIKASGIRIISMALGPEANLRCMAELASSPADLFRVGSRLIQKY